MRRTMRVVAAVALALGTAVLVTPSVGTSTFPGANGKIAFTTLVPGFDYEIMVVNPDGTGLTDLTNDPAEDGFPCWSADGSRIAFERDSGSGFDLWVMNADGSGQTQVTSDAGDERAPCWSPDGTKLVYEVPNQGGAELWVVDATGANETQLTSGNTDYTPNWSPDGATIVFSRQLSSGGSYDIWSVPAGGGTATNLTNVADQNDFSPCYSPDGARIAYGQTTPGEEQIFVMDADGSNPQQITNVPTPGPNAGEPCFSPDGTRIALDYNFRQYVMNADGTGFAPLVDTPDNATDPDWQPVVRAPEPVVLAPRFTG